MTQREQVHSARGPAALTLFVCLLVAGCGGGGDGGYGGNPLPPPPASPTIALTPPAGGSVNRTVNLSANVAAPAGVTRVEFLADGTVIGTSTTSPYTFAWDTSAVSNGGHSVTARVTDASNNVVTSAAVSITVNNNPAINVVLLPDEIFPRPASTASGSGTLTFNLINGAVTGHLTLIGDFPEASTQTSINQGYAGAIGPAVVNFVKNAAAAGQWDAAQGSMLTAGQLDELLSGQLYVKVTSAAFPTYGEIRGQIQTENIDVVFTAMSGDGVVPPVTINASGVAATTIDSLAGNATVHLNTLGADDATQAYVRKAAAGASSASNLIALTQLAGFAYHWSAQRQAITAQDRTDFTNNGWYVEVVTPGGAIRGQITPNPAPPTPVVTLSQLQISIFGACSGCHSGIPSGTANGLPGVMNLSSAAASFAALRNTQSIQQPAVLRVAPGFPNDSYLIRKLEGTPGINGSQMPPGGELTPAMIAQVRAWITAGAPNN